MIAEMMSIKIRMIFFIRQGLWVAGFC